MYRKLYLSGVSYTEAATMQQQDHPTYIAITPTLPSGTHTTTTTTTTTTTITISRIMPIEFQTSLLHSLHAIRS